MIGSTAAAADGGTSRKRRDARLASRMCTGAIREQKLTTPVVILPIRGSVR